MNDEAWREHANCKGLPIDMFFDDYEKSAKVQLEVDTICGNCIVRRECLEWAIANHIEGGVWGRKFLSQTPKGKKKAKELV